jgi:hypothetical protein
MQHYCLLACWAIGTGKMKYAVMKRVFCPGLTRAAKAGQKSIVPAGQDQRSNKEGPSHIFFLESTNRLNSQQEQPL